MSLRVSSVTMPWFIPDPIFYFLTGSNGLALAWAKTPFRVAFDMLSCSLMFLRGTLAFHNSTATLLSSMEKLGTELAAGCLCTSIAYYTLT